MGHPNFFDVNVSQIFLWFWYQCPTSCPNYATQVDPSFTWTRSGPMKLGQLLRVFLGMLIVLLRWSTPHGIRSSHVRLCEVIITWDDYYAVTISLISILVLWESTCINQAEMIISIKMINLIEMITSLVVICTIIISGHNLPHLVTIGNICHGMLYCSYDVTWLCLQGPH